MVDLSPLTAFWEISNNLEDDCPPASHEPSAVPDLLVSGGFFEKDVYRVDFSLYGGPEGHITHKLVNAKIFW